MEAIRSGTTTERIVRTGILTAVLVVFGAWYFWDGYVGYPKKNLDRLIQNLSAPPETMPEVDPATTRHAFEPLMEMRRSGQYPNEEEVRAAVGAPTVREDGTTFYFGPGGVGKITWQSGRAATVAWIDGDYPDSELMMQKVIGAIVGVLGLLMILQFVRVITTRIELTDAGLKVNSQGGTRFGGSPLIPFEAMTGIRYDDFKKKGWVEIDYQLEGGKQGAVSLNDYIHRAFALVVTVISKRKGWENPIEAVGEEAPDISADGVLHVPEPDEAEVDDGNVAEGSTGGDGQQSSS